MRSRDSGQIRDEWPARAQGALRQVRTRLAQSAPLLVLGVSFAVRDPYMLAGAIGMCAQWALIIATEQHRARYLWRRLPLLGVSRALLRGLTNHPSEAALQHIARELNRAMNGTHVLVAVRGEALTASSCSSSLHAIPDDCFDELQQRLEEGLWFRRLRASESLNLRTALDQAQVDSIVPLSINGRVIGFLGFGRTGSWRLQRADIDLLEEIAREVSAVVETRRLTDLASIDTLTQLPRRHVIEMRLAHELERGSRADEDFSVVLADIDFFKHVNDTFGHHAGDVVLRDVAGLLAAECRSIDMAGRWGGEEFVVVLPETDAEGALAVAEKLRERFESHTFVIGVTRLRVTISFGVVACPPRRFETVEEILAAADAALYAAKRNGRNRVCVFDAHADVNTLPRIHCPAGDSVDSGRTHQTLMR
jgi:diguanylate cyclase (GGDEF)-like protein